MKTNHICRNGLLLLGISLSLPAGADEALEPGPYFGADMGIAITSDASLKEFPGGGGGGHVEFDPGIRLSLGGGYRFSDWFRAGGEVGLISHGIDGADASYGQFPLMANVEFQLPNRSALTPFIGGGPGVSITTVSFDNDSLGGGARVDGTSADAVFAWQAYAGLRYKLNDTMSIGAVYKYFDVQASSWDVEDTSTDIRFGRTHTHSISVSFLMEF